MALASRRCRPSARGFDSMRARLCGAARAHLDREAGFHGRVAAAGLIRPPEDALQGVPRSAEPALQGTATAVAPAPSCPQVRQGLLGSVDYLSSRPPNAQASAEPGRANPGVPKPAKPLAP